MRESLDNLNYIEALLDCFFSVMSSLNYILTAHWHVLYRRSAPPPKKKLEVLFLNAINCYLLHVGWSQWDL